MAHALAKAASAAVKKKAAPDAKVRRQLTVLQKLRHSITNADDCNIASTGLDWLVTQQEAIRNNPKIVGLIAKTKAAYDAARAIRDDALVILLAKERGNTLEQDLRASIGRFRTAEARAKIQAQAGLTRKLTKQLAAAPTEEVVTVEVGSDVFEFEPAVEAGVAVTLQTSTMDATTDRKYWHMALVDPAKPRDKEGAIVPNEEAGIKALAAAVAAGTAPWRFLMLNAKATDAHATEHEDRLSFPGLVPYFELRPVRRR